MAVKAVKTQPFRLDVALWGVNLDHHATPSLAFIPTGMQVSLHRQFARALGRGHSHEQAATVLLGRRVTTFRSLRQVDFRALRDVLDDQNGTHPGAPYGEGAY